MSQVIVGTGLPEAVHSKLTSVPFLTTIFPSSGLGLILGGTEKFEKWRKKNFWKKAASAKKTSKITSHNTLSFHFFCCGTKRLKCFPRDVLLQGQRKLLLACNCRHNDHLYCKSVWFRKKWTLSPWPSEDFWQISYEKMHFSPLKIAFLVLKISLENFLNQT